MPKEFYTERDIEDLFKRGVMSLEITENVVLTELAYEKAGRVGMQLQHFQPENPPSAPVRPYIGYKTNTAASPIPTGNLPEQPTKELPIRIREAVIARMGSQIDSNLLDVIIERVLKSTGVK
jgi:hypothetical protein